MFGYPRFYRKAKRKANIVHVYARSVSCINCVKANGNVSDYFGSYMGVRQDGNIIRTCFYFVL